MEVVCGWFDLFFVLTCCFFFPGVDGIVLGFVVFLLNSMVI